MFTTLRYKKKSHEENFFEQIEFTTATESMHLQYAYIDNSHVYNKRVNLNI